MSKDLTNSPVERQNILNNPYALAEIEKAAGIRGIPFRGRTVVVKEQVAAFFEVTTRTVDNYLERFSDELRQLRNVELFGSPIGKPDMNAGRIPIQ